MKKIAAINSARQEEENRTRREKDVCKLKNLLQLRQENIAELSAHEGSNLPAKKNLSPLQKLASQEINSFQNEKNGRNEAAFFSANSKADVKSRRRASTMNSLVLSEKQGQNKEKKIRRHSSPVLK